MAGRAYICEKWYLESLGTSTAKLTLDVSTEVDDDEGEGHEHIVGRLELELEENEGTVELVGITSLGYTVNKKANTHGKRM